MATSPRRPADPVDGPWIDEWRPDDPQFWDDRGRRIARRNLIWSNLSEHLGFTVWSTYRMIPAIFTARSARLVRLRPGADERAAAARGRRDSAAALGITSAIGALGAFLVNRAFDTSAAATGNAEAALIAFAAFYACRLGLTWLCHLRRGAPGLVDLRV